MQFHFDNQRGYDVPDLGGVITEWRFQAASGSGTLALQILSEQPLGLDTYQPVAESAVETVTASKLNVFQTRISVVDNQLIALRIVSGNPDCRSTGFPPLFDTTSEASPAPVVGSPPTVYGTEHAGSRLNVYAELESDDDHDGFGDQTQDGCSDDPTRQDDCIDPTVTLQKGVTRKRNATFAFSADEPGSTFECKLDEAKYKPCTSPVKYKKLKREKHHFHVRAVDANGNRSFSELYSWVVKKKS